MPATDIQQTVDAVWRMEAAKIVATLTRAVGDVGLAEDLAQEALVDALTQWPDTGVPRNAGAWLTTVAKRKAIDHWRRQENLDTKYAVLARELETQIDEPRMGSRPHRRRRAAAGVHLGAPGAVAGRADRADAARGRRPDDRGDRPGLPDVEGDDRGADHPGEEDALADANVPFEVPDRSEYPQRLSAVLSVIYLIYNEGYSASFGQRWIRDELCSEALRLGRVLAALVPDEPEVHGLVALMEFQSSRFAARTDPDGRPILLEDQNRTKWDRAQIRRGVAALERAAEALQRKGTGWGPYALQAAIAECHATAPTADDTDWKRIVMLYDGLIQIAPSPVVDSTARSRWRWPPDPPMALEIVDGLTGLDGSYLLPSVRGELLARLGRDAGGRRRVRPRRADDRQRTRTRSVGRQGRSGAGLGPGHPCPCSDRRRRTGVEDLDGHVGVAVSAEVMQSRCRGDDVGRVVAGHRILGDGVSPMRGDDRRPRPQQGYLAIQRVAQHLGIQVIAELRQHHQVERPLRPGVIE